MELVFVILMTVIAFELLIVIVFLKTGFNELIKAANHITNGGKDE